MGEKVIRKVLVPNRGEIAVRIARTCREMKIETVLAHAAGDLGLVAAREFDQAVSLGDGDARETYLNIDRIIDAARRSGADAIHPGYGFLSERAALAAACEEADIVFVGPRARSIELMGSKAESRRLMESVGVPVVPGYHGEDQSLDRFSSEAATVGFPVLIKASGGGGGKGMKIVRNAAELPAALDSARREALKAFGDERLLLEKFVERPRHVEFQVFGDSSGRVIHLFERDCSIQRRHQKVVEESPAPVYSDELRQRMARSAVAAAEGVQYQNAGTVEFILTPEGEYYFLEMNTRLQVEHPVTEMVLGLDLVRAQIEVASGRPLPWKQGDLRQRGHAIECRVYAEDPDDRFLPQTGTIAAYSEPSGPGVRVDSGITAGTEVGVRYDPLLSKLIVHAESRGACIERMVRSLEDYIILGTRTNASYLRRVISHPAFGAGEVDTHFLERHEKELRRPDVPDELTSIAAVLAREVRPARGAAVAVAGRAGLPSLWEMVGSWGRGNGA